MRQAEHDWSAVCVRVGPAVLGASVRVACAVLGECAGIGEEYD